MLTITRITNKDNFEFQGYLFLLQKMIPFILLNTQSLRSLDFARDDLGYVMLSEVETSPILSLDKGKICIMAYTAYFAKL